MIQMEIMLRKMLQLPWRQMSKQKFLVAVLILTGLVLMIPQAVFAEKEATRPGIMATLKTFIGKRAWLKEAVVTNKSGTTLTVTKDAVFYTVLTDSTTIFRRKFGDKSSLAEVSVNDKLNVLGKWNNEAKTEIKATHIRNLSVQKRFATFFGIVKSVSGNTIVVTTEKGGDQTITIDASTKLVNRKMQTIVMADILVGHRIRIKGIWDMTNKTVTGVKQIKDFTIPVVKPSSTPAATP